MIPIILEYILLVSYITTGRPVVSKKIVGSYKIMKKHKNNKTNETTLEDVTRC